MVPVNSHIIFVISEIPDAENTTPHQRAKYLSTHYTVTFLTRSKKIPADIKKNAAQHYAFKYVDYDWALPLFVIWAIIIGVYLRFREGTRIVWTTNGPFSALSGFGMKLFGFTWISDIWDDPFLPLEIVTAEKASALRKGYVHFLCSSVSGILKYSDRVILTIMPDIVAPYKIRKKKIILSTNGVNLKATKRVSGVREKRFTIFYVGFVRKSRGIGTLLDAFHQLEAKYPDTKLVLAGPVAPEEREWLTSQIRSSSSVLVTGLVPFARVLRLETEASVCVYPFPQAKELDYIFPIKIVEYMAMRKAIVATRLKGAQTVLRHLENGIFVEPSNSESMAAAIESIYLDARFQTRLETAAFQTAQHYDWDHINTRILMQLNRDSILPIALKNTSHSMR
jgi:glycosyltransferase involved in cell wall biosynthesis